MVNMYDENLQVYWSEEPMLPAAGGVAVTGSATAVTI